MRVDGSKERKTDAASNHNGEPTPAFLGQATTEQRCQNEPSPHEVEYTEEPADKPAHMIEN